MPTKPSVSDRVLPLCLLLLSTPLFSQQSYVSRFDVFGGYSFLNSSHINLFEQGIGLQAGVRPFTWCSLGFDYSRTTGNSALSPGMLVTAVQQTLGAQMAQLAAAGLVPAGYSLSVPFDSVTQTFAAGPQVAFRHWKQFTIFVRPDLGLIKELATPRPADKISTGIVNQLAPSGSKKDNVIFYGFGGGVDLNISRHFSLRIQADLVRDHLFDDLLKDSRNTIRFSIGPAFNFGKNIARK
ncbi:MAG: hypothetical protein NTY38_25295 [Acidobacteria bacterium]|nr:hypothetical protein [Acidobacteriota bacterium]